MTEKKGTYTTKEPAGAGVKCILELMETCAKELTDVRSTALLAAARAELNQLITKKNWYRVMLETTEDFLRSNCTAPVVTGEISASDPSVRIFSVQIRE